MKLFHTTWCIGLVLVATATGAMAQDSKIGYISNQRIITESGPAKASQTKLEQEFSKRQKELADLQASLKALGDKFERDAPVLTESQRSSRQKEYADQSRDFQRKQREFQEDLNSRRNEELQQVYEKANKALKQVAETDKYDMILSEGVVYSNSKHDVTDKVLKILNAAK